ncbi:DUF4148 domain-containing protein [Noviherbaspirillum sp. ST9]|uniref:DUF4148 domain-containing protein n=1 Tax=Noviherbaspirillum sp. ST9 TaxID=3401606 RepID=UPI003B588C77
MKVSNWKAGLAAGVVLAASGTCFAAVGLIDGADPFPNFQSTKSRAEVNQEYLDAKAQGLLSHGDANLSPSNGASTDIGARGPAGSRYQARTREEVMEELREYQQTKKPNGTNDFYFGG